MILLNQSTQTTKGRMMLLSLPLILFPFLTLLFWAAGGGKGGEAKAQNTANMGLNLHLPEAQMKNGKVTDKLSFYQRASKDSLRREEEKRYDPFWKENVGVKDSFHLNSLHGNEQKDFAIHYNPLPPSPYSSNNVDANEAKVYQKTRKAEQRFGTIQKHIKRDQKHRRRLQFRKQNFSNRYKKAGSDDAQYKRKRG